MLNEIGMNETTTENIVPPHSEGKKRLTNSQKRKIKRQRQRQQGTQAMSNTLRQKIKRKNDKCHRLESDLVNQFEEEYKCPICLDVFYKPVRFANCTHRVCILCFHNMIIEHQ